MKQHPTAHNRKATFDVSIEETFEAGIVLKGDEIKSIRAGRLQLTGAYVKLLRGKGSRDLPSVVLIGSHFSQAADPERTRELLLHAKEISRLDELMHAKGRVAVPLKIYLKRGWAKVSVGVGTGRKQYDKRNLLKEREADREQRRAAKGLS